MVIKNLFWFLKKIWTKPILLSEVKGEDFIVLKIEGIIHWLIYFLPLCLSPLFTFSGAKWHSAE